MRADPPRNADHDAALDRLADLARASAARAAAKRKKRQSAAARARYRMKRGEPPVPKTPTQRTADLISQDLAENDPLEGLVSLLGRGEW
jgi:hypothetical protein